MFSNDEDVITRIAEVMLIVQVCVLNGIQCFSSNLLLFLVLISLFFV